MRLPFLGCLFFATFAAAVPAQQLFLAGNARLETFSPYPDADGDGGLDLIQMVTQGRFAVFSSGTGARLRQFQAAGSFGDPIALGPDAPSGDGWADIVMGVSEPFGTESFGIATFSPGTLDPQGNAQRLWAFPGNAAEAARWDLSTVVTAVGDLNGNGHEDVAISAFENTGNPATSGYRFLIFDPALQTLLTTFDLGGIDLSIGRVSGPHVLSDGRLVFALSQRLGVSPAFVHIMVPGNSTPQRTLQFANPNPRFGVSVELTEPADYDGDGIEELLLNTSYGLIEFIDTQSFAIQSYTRPFAIAGPLGDLDGDGAVEWFDSDGRIGQYVTGRGFLPQFLPLQGSTSNGLDAVRSVGDLDGDGVNELQAFATRYSAMGIWNPTTPVFIRRPASFANPPVFSVDLGPAYAGRSVFVFGTTRGSAPPLQLPGLPTIPLDVTAPGGGLDPYFEITSQVPPFGTGLTLDSNGRGDWSMTQPLWLALTTAVSGARLWHAALVVGGGRVEVFGTAAMVAR